jgi:hypothetical protein
MAMARGASANDLPEISVKTQFKPRGLRPPIQGLPQGAVQAKLFRDQNHAWIGAPPKYRLALAEPGKDALAVGFNQTLGRQVIAGRQKTWGGCGRPPSTGRVRQGLAPGNPGQFWLNSFRGWVH